MSLTTGRGPLSSSPSGLFSAPVPSGLIYVEPYPRRIRARLGEVMVIDSEQVKLVHRPGEPTSYAFPAAEVPSELAEREPAVPGHVRVSWSSVDAWYEEDEQLQHQSYPKNPYHRVDCLRTSRRLRVEIDGVVVVHTTETLGVYETSLSPRLYVAKAAIRMELFRMSPSTSWCSYKGHATWWTAHVNSIEIPDVAWSYEDPLPESTALRGMLSFDERKASVLAELPQ